MFSINRIVAIVQPKEPYYQWAASIDSHGPQPSQLSPAEFRTAYLLPEADNPRRALSQCATHIFEEQLNSWHRAISAWPKDRSFAAFQRWFDVELIGMVWDVCEDEIERR